MHRHTYTCTLLKIQKKIKQKEYLQIKPQINDWFPDFPGGSDGKNVCLQHRKPGFDFWVGKIPWRRKWQPTPVLLPGKSHGPRSLVGYSAQVAEPDTTEQLHFHFFLNYKKVPEKSIIKDVKSKVINNMVYRQ